MEYIWKKFPEEIIKGDNITESGFNYEEEYEKRVYKKVWMDIAWYCGRNGRRIFVLVVCRLCTTGTCPITSSPVNSSIWGAAMGGLLLSSFMPEHRKIKKEE